MPFKLQNTSSIRYRPARLKRYLDEFLISFDFQKHVGQDPVSFVRRFARQEDREVAALMSSSFAYGRVGQIFAFLERLFAILGPNPYDFVIGLDRGEGKRLFKNLQYRFQKGEDIARFLDHLRTALLRYGSLEKLFMSAYCGAPDEAGRVPAAMDGFVRILLNPSSLDSKSPVSFLLPSPAQGSTCKRLNLFLRWMVRGPDEVDLGLWKSFAPRDLIIPLDTHVARISRYLGLTSRNSLNWQTAVEITRNLSLLDPQDPVKYDFALCHLGISGDCPSRSDWLKCRPCPLRPVCRCWN